MNRWLVLLFLMGWGNAAFARELPSFEGLTEPKQRVGFSSQVEGILEDVKVERGDRVTRGQILARLKSGVEVASVRLAQARVEYGQRKSLRNQELYKKQLISIHDKDELETEIQLAQLQLVEAQERLALRTIRSTVDGVVVSRQGSPGEYVGEEPFLTVAQINPLNVELVIPVEFFGTIREGMDVHVVLDDPVGGSHPAKVVIVDQMIDAASGTFGVRVELPNPKLNLPAGLKCHVVF
ncbi:MAG: efflux RND transporter periplasmic adaptor subunit [Desulfuromonadaceae bacterium]|nr:efflux RND transporter periplasmic adaptor subunit [Desulfuromonadaceae bacterium]